MWFNKTGELFPKTTFLKGFRLILKNKVVLPNIDFQTHFS